MANGSSANSFESLGSSNSCLDGVPFRIGSKFLPTEKIHVPPQLLQHSSCELLEEKYSFEIEEGVLAWIRAKEETRRKQKLEAEERKARENETFNPSSQMADGQSEESDNEEESLYVNTSQLTVNTRPNFDSILTPTPIYSNTVQKPAESSLTKPNTAIDLTLFEKETDAFENLDLQTINDMEELKNVFQDSRAFNASPSNNAEHQKMTSASTSEEVAPLSLQSKQPVSKPGKVCPNGFVSSSGNPNEVEEGEYVSLMVDFKKNHVSFQSNQKDTSQTTTSKSTGVQGGSLPSHMVNSALYKQVLPANCSLPQSSNKPSLNGLNGVNKDKSSFGIHSDLVYSLSNSPPTVGSAPASIRHQSVNYENVMDVRLHSARSDPELSQFPQAKVSPRSSPPPVPQRSTPDQNVYENVPIKKPLPPVPSPKHKGATRSSQVNTSSSTKPSQLNHHESHVYSTLSVKDQQFVCKLGSMGFPRERVSRAVAKFGQDEKEVIEHLCHVDTLVGRGFHPMKTETALFLFRNNLNKAAEYMDSFAQFQELGFEPEKIREALIKHNIDRDKALDDLTAT